jgi:hypothetical protein
MKKVLAYEVTFNEDYGSYDKLKYAITEVHIKDEDEYKFDLDYYEDDCKYLRSFEEAKEFVVKELNEEIDRYKKGLELANVINKEDMVDGMLYSSKLNSKTSK